ncbi:MAG: hypothetical protein L7U52_01230 [Alphaproteobacteria bacterium]|nr:hypothetical protein [Alphaproteobacteria bacterium]
MWRQIFDLAKVIGIITIAFVSSPLHAAVCKTPPEKMQLHFGFDWPITERGGLADVLTLQCGEPENIDRLRQRVDAYFRLAGLPVEQVTWREDSQPNIAEFEIATSQDTAQRRAIMFDIIRVARGDALIPILQISGPPQADQELTARFVVNQEFISNVGARVELQWRRDGQPIKEAFRARYRLQDGDVDAAISADIMVKSGARILAHRQVSFEQYITMAEKKPEALEVAIRGVPKVGQRLELDYIFSDANPEDSEKDSRIIWLRDNFSIPGAKGSSYQIVRDDVGHILSAQIEPISADGQRGAPVTVSLPVQIIDGLEQQKKDFLASLMPEMEKAGKEASKPSETASDLPSNLAQMQAENPIVAALVSPQVNKPIADNLGMRLPTSSDLYLTKGFKIIQGTPRQITGLDIERGDLLTLQKLREIEAKFIGRDIEIGTLKTIVDEINTAFKEEGYELSRALLPEQIVSNGRVAIKIVEVRLGDIVIEGNEAIKEEYILSQVGFKTGDYISLATIEERLKEYNATNKSNLTTELAPGSEYGTTDIFIQTSEPSRVELPTLSIDNYNKGVSKIIPQSFSATFNNLLRRDDEITVSMSDGKGTAAQSIGFSSPFGKSGGNLTVNMSKAKTKSTIENAELVGYRGTSTSFGFGYSYPLFSATNWSGFTSVSLGRGKNDMVAPITGDLLAKSTTDKVVVSFPTSYNNGTTALSVSPAWHFIHTSTEIPPSEDWLNKFDMDMSASHFLSPQLTANFSGRYLYTTSRAFLNMPDEIISIGGPGSVRAYQPSESSGYRGFFASAELRSDLANWEEVSMPKWLPNIQPYAFIDHVNAREVFKKVQRSDRWSGYGVGLSLPSIFDYLSFDTYWAHPLDNSVHTEEKQAYKDDLLQFSLKASIKLN